MPSPSSRSQRRHEHLDSSVGKGCYKSSHEWILGHRLCAPGHCKGKEEGREREREGEGRRRRGREREGEGEEGGGYVGMKEQGGIVDDVLQHIKTKHLISSKLSLQN